MGAFPRKRKSEERYKPECFYTRFDKDWKLVEKHDRTKGMS